MKILITGANGFLARHVIDYFSKFSFKLTGVVRGESYLKDSENYSSCIVDLTSRQAVKNMMNAVKPDVIIHAAAMSKPDECAQNKDACLAINVNATKYLLEACEQYKPHFIYISTDFIFGENGPHSEDDMPAPLNFYGETKLLAEQLVKESTIPFTIVRPVFIYGPLFQGSRPSFLHWIKNNLEKNQPLKIVSDQQRTPTFATDICKGLNTIISQKKEGVFHLAGRDLLSPYQMAVEVATHLNLDASLLQKVTSDTFNEPVKRARYSGLKIDKAQNLLQYDPVSFKEGVELTFKAIL